MSLSSTGDFNGGGKKSRRKRQKFGSIPHELGGEKGKNRPVRMKNSRGKKT